MNQPQYEPGPAGQQTDGMAIGALICAIAGLFVCGVVLGVVALVLAQNSQQRIDASGGRLGGAGLVTAARIIGIIAIVLSVLVLILVFSS